MSNLARLAQVRRLMPLHRKKLSTAPATAALTSPHQAWQVIEERKLQEFDIDATLLVHKKTRARYLHMACKDDNNAFSVNFRTTPMDSTGVAHILEHTALCGSSRFPVRDPFMKVMFLQDHTSLIHNIVCISLKIIYPFRC